MIITNINNLPKAFESLAQSNYEPKPKQYSVTTLLKPTREIMLLRRHNSEIKQDVSDMVWMIFGSAVHKVLEEHDKTGMAELHLAQEIENGYFLSGRIDLYNAAENTLEDYKTASTWKVIYEDYEDWRLQGLMYAWLLMREGKYVSELRFHALLKDWTQKDKRIAVSKNSFYPEHPVYTWRHTITVDEMQFIDRFIKDKFKEIAIAETLQDEELLLCSAEDRWNNGNTYAVMKSGRKTAVRVFDLENEAVKYKLENSTPGNELTVEVRAGEDKKCMDYCLAADFCSYYKQYVKGNK